ncbi:AlwI family type II restriction endonuclease [Butyricicoccus faecihominis]|uniref:AlwI family type II restriction endonuclease n=1 Tax=Butyricicoccus faecihominis TaxID=1712515 RepID=A0ABQ1E2G9_9FIRM|nr:AlwI family type II restriction endonuclease [Butyricicoccus faecihominis]GFO89180.1 AlwI family type II restriction endonuclease [Butyricicoccus faecihominis]GGM75826.1 AlwI family type II restriction endonuclease [Butyricicoccus faecihominis]
MASLNNSRMLFFTTSPRTPFKMIPEIELLGNNFSGQKWSKYTQVNFIELLSQEGFFNGKGSKNNLDFSARDRINRAPKALGFVSLNPTIELTEVGKLFVTSKRKEEILLRQLLKFQFPSPFHTQPTQGNTDFWIKPYLEILRLIHHFGTLSFDEVMLFGLQMTSYKMFDDIVKKVEDFRIEKIKYQGRYKQLKANIQEDIILQLFDEEINSGQIKTRESNEKSIKKFVSTKSSNMRDYTDACFRYLRSTGVVNVSQRGRSLSIVAEKMPDVEFILATVDRNPIFINDEEKYTEILYNSALPALYTDNEEVLIQKLAEYTSIPSSQIHKLSFNEKKERLFEAVEDKKQSILNQQIVNIKNYKHFDDIMNTFDDIEKKNVLDIPLMLEWNTWRAMTMLDGGSIKANLKFDDNGVPMSTAQGNMADIFCDYEEYGLTVEVTTASGQKQYEMESEPVSRHLAKYKKETGKDAYCLFIAPKINAACIAHFFMLHKMNIAFYGGKSVIVPVDINTFKKMLTDSYKATYQPNPAQVKSLFDYSLEVAEKADNEVEWYTKITEKALNWLSA